MNHSDLERAVARAMGETVTTIKRLGFQLVDPGDACSSLVIRRDAPHDVDSIDTSIRGPHHDLVTS